MGEIAEELLEDVLWDDDRFDDVELNDTSDETSLISQCTGKERKSVNQI